MQNTLFSRQELRPFLEDHRARTLKKIQDVHSADQLEAEAELVRIGARIEPPTIDRAAAIRKSIEPSPGQVGLSVRIPFTGEQSLFQYTPSTFSTVFPRARIFAFDDPPIIEVRAVAETPDQRDRLLDAAKAEVDRLEQYLGWLTSDIEAHNGRLATDLDAAIALRLRQFKDLGDTGDKLGGTGI